MEKKFYWLYVTVFINIIGVGMIFPILPLFAKTFNASSFQVGLLTAMLALVQFFTAPFIGKLSDKYGRKPILLFSIAVNTIAFLVTGFSPSLSIIFLGMALQGLGSAGVLPVAIAYVADVTKGHERSTYISRITGTFALGFMIGPVVGGLLGSSFLTLPYMAAAIVGILNLIVIYFFLHETLTTKDKNIALREGLINIKPVFKAMRGEFGILFYLMFAWAFYVAHLGLTIPFYVQEIFSFKAFETGLLFSITGTTAAITQWVILPRIERKLGDLKTIFVGIVILFIFQILAPLAPTASIFIVVMIFSVWGSATMRPSINAYLSKKTTEGQGATMGLAFSFESLGRVMGPIVLGGLIATTNLIFPFYVVVLVLGIGILLFVTIERRRQRRKAI